MSNIRPYDLGLGVWLGALLIRLIVLLSAIQLLDPASSADISPKSYAKALFSVFKGH